MGKTQLAVALIAGSFFGLAVAQQNPITIDTTVQLVCPDGAAVDAAYAKAGAIVRYTLNITNTSEMSLPAGVVVVTSPVPSGMHLLVGSEQRDQTWGDVLVEYQRLNGAYTKPPAVASSLPANQRADNSYQAVRWTILHTVGPGQSGWFRYDVKVGSPASPQTWSPDCPGAPPAGEQSVAPALPPLPTGGLSVDPVARWVESVFGQAGIVETGCPGNAPSTGGIYICGTTTVDFDLFRMQWDTYSESAPNANQFTPASAWRLEQNRYARYYIGPSDRSIVVSFTQLNKQANRIVVGATKGN